MKVFLVLTIAALVFASPGSAWDLPQTVLDYVTGVSRIPQFIRNTHHPWLEENKLWLGRLKDTKQALCSLDSELRPGNGGSHIYPPDLYKKLNTNNDGGNNNNQGAWRNVDARLKEILDCPAALHDVETFDVNIYVADGRYGSTYERPDPPKSIPGLFIDTMKSMPNLNRLNWQTWSVDSDNFRLAFQQANLTLSSVRHLRLSQYTHWLTEMCPDIETLESGGGPTSTYWRWSSKEDARLLLIYSARHAMNLTHFGLEGEWELAHVHGKLLHTAYTIWNILPRSC